MNYPIDSFSFAGDIVMRDRCACAFQHAPSATDRPAFYPLAQFPRLQEIALNWEVIRDECMNLDAPLLEIDRVGKNHDQVHAEIIAHTWSSIATSRSRGDPRGGAALAGGPPGRAADAQETFALQLGYGAFSPGTIGQTFSGIRLRTRCSHMAASISSGLVDSGPRCAHCSV